MKKYLLLLLAFFLFVPSLIADDMKDRKKMSEEIQKFKIDYLAKEMGLSEAEKAKFEPIYNEYDEARRKAGAEAWRFERKLKKRKTHPKRITKNLANSSRRHARKSTTSIRNTIRNSNRSSPQNRYIRCIRVKKNSSPK